MFPVCCRASVLYAQTQQRIVDLVRVDLSAITGLRVEVQEQCPDEIETGCDDYCITGIHGAGSPGRTGKRTMPETPMRPESGPPLFTKKF